jgi:hypothetical protein
MCADSHAHALLPEQATHQVLNVMDFSSARARMSVILRAPDGTIRLHCKGSDAKMLPRLRADTDPALLSATHANLHAFSVNVRALLCRPPSFPFTYPLAPSCSVTYPLAPSCLVNKQMTLAHTAGSMPRILCSPQHPDWAAASPGDHSLPQACMPAKSGYF